jgi:hypothetical protein
MKIKKRYIGLIIFSIGILYILFRCIVWVPTYTLSDFEKDPLLERNPIELAIEHHQSTNQIKWLGYYGYTGYIPGIPDEIRKATDNSEVHWIIGTGDALLGEEHEQYNLTAQEFAEIYNRKRMELNK